jgi:hypothetical protein
MIEVMILAIWGKDWPGCRNAVNFDHFKSVLKEDDKRWGSDSWRELFGVKKGLPCSEILTTAISDEVSPLLATYLVAACFRACYRS